MSLSGQLVRRTSQIVVGWSWAWSALAMVAIGGARITRPVIWRDELCSISAARRSLPDLFAMLHHVDAVSGFYYLLLHAWIALFGDSLLAVRIPSLLAMGGAAAFVAMRCVCWALPPRVGCCYAPRDNQHGLAGSPTCWRPPWRYWPMPSR
jgi:uncharacterized membrane protein